jgi:hypothetical protein
MMLLKGNKINHSHFTFLCTLFEGLGFKLFVVERHSCEDLLGTVHFPLQRESLIELNIRYMTLLIHSLDIASELEIWPFCGSVWPTDNTPTLKPLCGMSQWVVRHQSVFVIQRAMCHSPEAMSKTHILTEFMLVLIYPIWLKGPTFQALQVSHITLILLLVTMTI